MSSPVSLIAEAVRKRIRSEGVDAAQSPGTVERLVVGASLPDGPRLHVVIPDLTRRHWSVNIRKFRSGMRGLADLVRLGSLSQLAADYLEHCVRAGQNILVSGATQSGKTTLLGALLGSAPVTDRVITVEETFELALTAPDWVALQCRHP